jgi:glycosyltransferase involved in cell wall biosynthesis
MNAAEQTEPTEYCDYIKERQHRQPLHIAVVSETYPPEVNGVAMTTGRNVQGLLRDGHTVQLVRPRQHANDIAAQTNGFDEWLVPGLAIPRYDMLRMGLPAKQALLRQWSQKRPDVVHVVTEGPLGWSALAAARHLYLPVSSGFHTNFHSYSRHYGIGWLRGPITAYLREFHNRTDATLVPTADMAGELAHAGYRNLRVVARGVDTQLFSPARRSAELRRSWGLGDDDLAVIHVGRLAAEKNLRLLISTFFAIREQAPNARLVLVGDGPERRRIAAACPDCVFAGMRSGEDLATHYASGDLFLFPSVTETWGNVTTEALASGLAVVAYDYAAAHVLIEDGQNGLLAPRGDHLAFIAAALRVARDPQLRASLRFRAREGVARMDWGSVVGDLVSSLSAVIRSHRRKAHHDLHFAAVPD